MIKSLIVAALTIGLSGAADAQEAATAPAAPMERHHHNAPMPYGMAPAPVEAPKQ